MDVPIRSYQAPINYVGIRRAFNTVRAAGAIVVALGSVVTMTWDFPSAPYVLLASLVIADRRPLSTQSRRQPLLAPLVIDVIGDRIRSV